MDLTKKTGTRLLLVAVFSIFNFKAHAYLSIIYETDRAKELYDGKPKKVELTTECADKKARQIALFNENGALEKSSTEGAEYADDFLGFIEVKDVSFKYENGYLVEYSGNPSVGARTEGAYIESYNVIKFKEDGRPHSAVMELENVVKRDKIVENNQLKEAESNWARNGYKSLHSYTYDDASNMMIESVVSRGAYNETVKRSYVHYYDGIKRLVESYVLEPESDDLMQTFIHKFNSDGKILESKTHTRHIILEYKDGQPDIQSVYSSMGLLSGRYKYEIQKTDQCGNWVVAKASVSRLEDHMKNLSLTQDNLYEPFGKKDLCKAVTLKRVIDYWEPCSQ